MVKYIAVIPAYEPEKILVELVKELYLNNFYVIVVNDGSKETYDDIFNSLSPYANVLKHKENKGKGCALKTAFTYIENEYSDDVVIVTLDADGQHTVSDAKQVCEKAYDNPLHIVLGTRVFGKDIPLKSRLGNIITRNVYEACSGKYISDTQTGLRAFSGKMLDVLKNIKGDRYEYEMNVIMECQKKGIQVDEVPIETIYIDNNSGSHFNPVKDSFMIYKDIIKFAASSLTGFAIDYLLFSLLIIVTASFGKTVGVMISNICARVVSASINFTINRRVVFKSDVSLLSSAIRYFVLAVGILIANTVFLDILVVNIGINSFVAKIITEMIFFVVSWLVQKLVVFKSAKVGGK